MNREETKAKVAKLMSMAEHGRGNQFEAEAALRMASSLMTKYAIDQAEIANASGNKKASFEWSTTIIPLDPINGSKTTVGWLGTMAVYIANFTDTKMGYVRKPEHGYCFKVEGEIMDVEYAGYLLKHLRDTIRRQSAEFVGNRKEREDFRRGMVERIGVRMKTLKEEAKEEMREAGEATAAAGSSGVTALAVIEQKITLRDEQFGKFKVSNSKVRAAGDYAFGAGRAAGDKVGFGRPVGHEQKRWIGN